MAVVSASLHRYCVMYLAVPPRVYVAQRGYNSCSGYYLTVQESDGNVQICFQAFGIVREPLHIFVETTNTNSSDYPPAIGNIYETCMYDVLGIVSSHQLNSDYKATASTLVFEPSNEIVLQQCLEIEIINDLVPEDWEVFTLLLSTNNSAVDLITDRADVYIQPNNGNIIP